MSSLSPQVGALAIWPLLLCSAGFFAAQVIREARRWHLGALRESSLRTAIAKMDAGTPDFTLTLSALLKESAIDLEPAREAPVARAARKAAARVAELTDGR